MALRKSVTTEMGITAEYWKVSPHGFHSVVSTQDGVSSAAVQHKVVCYVSRTARDVEGAKPIPGLEAIARLEGEAATTALASGDPRPALYTYLKTLPMFAGAEDVIES